ncbi:hypothetical protein THAOC_31767 [Thalassiosira oceanica]|uniref:Uncharacterized protein n=1 Tax=Thalassiosira oceanica TaxID=159749 RepID=K0R7F3_THAOC|nr:hypothetical protein THAOC_31767 [Thalassiosira oceanica]|eukprot:EJK49363.1 hypothetical protein THAOC_31767 [Thalassiosira oceanica]
MSIHHKGAIAPEPEQLAKFPDVHMFLNDRSDYGGHLCRDKVNPKIRSCNSCAPSKFKIVLLAGVDTFSIDEPEENISCKSDFFKRLNEPGRHVAIRSADGKYISCRNPARLPFIGKSSLVEYRDRIGAFEVFKVKYHYSTSSYTFQSVHHKLSLRANYTFWTACCRESENDGQGRPMNSWTVSALLPSSAREERVEFIGAAKIATDGDPSIEDTQTEILEDFFRMARDSDVKKRHVRVILNHAAKSLEEGDSTSLKFGHGQEGRIFTHYLMRSQGLLFIVIASPEFSAVIAGALVDELRDLHQKYLGEGREYTEKKLEDHGLGVLETMKKELDFRMSYADEENLAHILSLCRELRDKMQDNITEYQKLLEDTEKCKEAAENLFKQSKEYKKNAIKIRKRQAKKYAHLIGAIGAGVGVSVGALTGWLIGGPAGAAVLATQGAEIAAGVGDGAGVGGILGFGIAKVSSSCMWSSFKHTSLRFAPASAPRERRARVRNKVAK